MPQNAFRINNRRILLTYAQVGLDFDWEGVVRLLHELGFHSRIARELHADGGIHYHVYADHGTAYSTRNARVFDHGGSHPNIAPVRSRPDTVYDYVGKDGDIVHDDIPERPGPDNGGNAKGRRHDVWTTILASPDKDSFFEACEKMAPRELVTSFTSVSAFADWKYRPKRERYKDPRGFDCNITDYPELDQWVRDSIGMGVNGRYADLIQ